MEHTSTTMAGASSAAAAGSLVLGQASTVLRQTGSPSASGRGAPYRPGSVYHAARKTLKFGMRGPDVKALQERLHYLHYFVGKINGQFGWDTQEGVWAFKEVQTGKIAPPHANRVDARMQRCAGASQAAQGAVPARRRRLRIEINKKIEVLVLYDHDKQCLISHVSTASTAAARTALRLVHAWRAPPGDAITSLARSPTTASARSYMYWPVFFIGYTYAIHGFPNPKWHNRWYGVPLKPASHGCVRIPLDLSQVLPQASCASARSRHADLDLPADHPGRPSGRIR